jgi:hypothetical protein
MIAVLFGLNGRSRSILTCLLRRKRMSQLIRALSSIIKWSRISN